MKSPQKPAAPSVEMPDRDTDMLDAREYFDSDDSAIVPSITRMPEGYEVEEHRVGQAIGQWVLQLRCQCGRRWFELKPVSTTTCPRCCLLVCVEMQE